MLSTNEMNQSANVEKEPSLPDLPRAASNKDDVEQAADGNLRAWLLLLGSFFMVFNTWSVLPNKHGLLASSNTRR